MDDLKKKLLEFCADHLLQAAVGIARNGDDLVLRVSCTSQNEENQILAWARHHHVEDKVVTQVVGLIRKQSDPGFMPYNHLRYDGTDERGV